MTAIAGALYLNERCDDRTIRLMLEAVPHHGPAKRIVLDRGAGIGQADRDGLNVRISSAHGGTSGQGGADTGVTPSLVFSGVLHNTSELAATLGVHGDDPETLTLAAYAQWGERCPERMLGEFAFILWDPARQRLLAARDSLGTRPLFFYRANGVWLVASEYAQLAAVRSLEPNDDAFQHLLAIDIEDIAETYWRDVRRLPPAHVLVVDGDGQRLLQYWSPDPNAELRYARDEDYAEQFREIFAEAIHCRMTDDAPIGCLFSGGVDSSAVMSMIGHLDEGSAKSVEGFASIFAAAPIDDRLYIDAVRQQYGLSVTCVNAPVIAPVRDLPREIRRMYSPFIDSNHQVLDSLFSACVERGCRVLMTGLRGDDVFGGVAYVADKAMRLQWGEVRRDLEQWSNVLGASPRRLIYPLCVRPWLERIDVMQPLFDRSRITNARRRVPTRRPFPSLAREEAHQLALGSYTVLTTELFELNAASRGLVPTYPFWDRRLVEFMLAVPQEMRMYAGVTKRVLRNAMVGVMPEVNRVRADKLSLGAFFRRGLTHEDRALVEDAVKVLHPRLAEMVRRDRLSGMLDDLFADRPVPLLKLWFLICTNLWLRQFANGEGGDAVSLRISH